MTRRARGLGGERGQTATEYLMIAGLITTIAITVLTYVYPRFRCQFKRVVECMINDYDDCMGNPPVATTFCP